MLGLLLSLWDTIYALSGKGEREEEEALFWEVFLWAVTGPPIAMKMGSSNHYDDDRAGSGRRSLSHWMS
jgi:hypothetical protein